MTPRKRIKKRKKKRNASGKGSLLKGVSHRLPGDILDDPMFRECLKKEMRHSAGIYALYRDKKLYYTGLTNNLFGRVRWHLRDRHKNRWNHFIIFRIRRVRYLRDIETLLHYLVETRGNKAHGRVPRDANLNHVLRGLVRDYKRKLANYERAFRSR